MVEDGKPYPLFRQWKDTLEWFEKLMGFSNTFAVAGWRTAEFIIDWMATFGTSERIYSLLRCCA